MGGYTSVKLIIFLRIVFNKEKYILRVQNEKLKYFVINLRKKEVNQLEIEKFRGKEEYEL